MKCHLIVVVAVCLLALAQQGCCGCQACAEGCAQGMAEGLEESMVEGLESAMATEQQCYDMLRNGTKLKALDADGPFGELSEAEQEAELDKIMAEDEMVTAVEECQTQVPASMAQCIIDATTVTEYEACEYM